MHLLSQQCLSQCEGIEMGAVRLFSSCDLESGNISSTISH